jgi:hypothetical protein
MLVAAWPHARGEVSDYNPDYRVAEPVAPQFKRDADTTFLVDFSKHALKSGFAAGPPMIECDQPAWVKGGGLRGRFRISSEKNLQPAKWTIELILRVPTEPLSTHLMGGWQASERENSLDYSVELYPTGFRLFSPARAGGPQHDLSFEASVGPLHEAAPSRWVYVACGLDAEARRGAAIVRDMEGRILGGMMRHVSLSNLDQSFLDKDKIPAADRPAAIAAAWEAMAKSLRRSPGPITIGHGGIDILKVRISRGFREDLLLPQPARRSSIEAAALDSKRAQKRTVSRTVGLPGYRNFVRRDVSETFLPLVAGDQVVLPLPGLKPSLYTVFLDGTIARAGRDTMPRVWRPAPMDFELRDSGGTVVARGRMPLKQGFEPRMMQGFHFHIVEPGDYTAVFTLRPTAQETVELMGLRLQDQLAGLPHEAVKRKQNLESGPSKQLTTLTDARRKRDDAIWAALPPLNTPLQIHDPVKVWQKLPAGAPRDAWQNRGFENLPNHMQVYETFRPLDLINTETGTVVPAAELFSGAVLPGDLPDDGTGVYLTPEKFPGLDQPMVYGLRAWLMGRRYLLFAGAIIDSKGAFWGRMLPQEYFAKGDPEVGHDAAMALVRFAYDWPALEENCHELRLNTHAPDLDFNDDRSHLGHGKFFYDGWSGTNFVGLLESYDQIFPYIQGNQVLADAVHRFIPSVKTPEDVVAFLDRSLVFAGVRDFNRGIISAAPVEDVAARVMGFHPATAPWFDLTRSSLEIYPARGTYQEMYATAVPRSGTHYIGSYMDYAFGLAQDILTKANAQAELKKEGFKPIMDLSDVDRYPKVRAAGDFLIDAFTAGGFPLMVGDTSGGTHFGRVAAQRLKAAKASSAHAFALWQDPRHAWLLKNLHGDTRPEVATAAQGVADPLLHQRSRFMGNEIGVIEQGTDGDDPLRKTAVSMYIGLGQGHAHNDQLDLNIFGMGLPMAVDLACRSEGSNWSRPGSSWGFLHNHAIAHESENPSGAGNKTGEPWMEAFAPPLMRGRYVGQAGEALDRGVVVVPLGESDDCYVFDLQRLRGGKLHTWCFHGCETADLEINTPMQPAETTRWVDRLLEGTRRAGTAPETLQATWTMTREAKDFAHTFNGGGTIKTVAAEQAVLGEAYDSSRGRARLRATLLGQAGAAVLQGNPYSQSYAYSFPFLWVQAAATPESVYPAVYEYYRGDEPALKEVRLVSREPLVVRVVTRQGQTDTFTADGRSLAVVSTDAQGLRWAKLSGGTTLAGGELSLEAARGEYRTAVDSIDYRSRTLSTRDGLPPDPHVVIGNDGRRTMLRLTGSGTSFTFADDLLIHEGRITDVKATGDRIEVSSNQKLLFDGYGNRKAASLVQIDESGEWQFRNGKPIRRPSPTASLSGDIFKDANGDGFVNVRTYECGLNDDVVLLADVEVRRRADGGHEVRTNVSVKGTLKGKAFSLDAGDGWQAIPGR